MFTDKAFAGIFIAYCCVGRGISTHQKQEISIHLCGVPETPTAVAYQQSSFLACRLSSLFNP